VEHPAPSWPVSRLPVFQGYNLRPTARLTSSGGARTLITIVDELTLEQLDSESEAFIAAVLQTPDIATFCSGPDFVISAAHTLTKHNKPVIRRCSDTWLTLASGKNPRMGRVLMPLEATWGFASPLIGREFKTTCELLEELLADERMDWDVTMLSGLSFQQLPLLVTHFEQHYDVLGARAIDYHIGSLEEGFEGYLERRSPRFRAGIRRSEDEAANHGIEFDVFQPTGDARSIVDRIFDIEKRSWKGISEQGILANPDYAEFYDMLITRCITRQNLHVAIARHEYTDIAYVVGGVMGDTYRGFQMSYDHKYAKYGLGNLTQIRMIEHLCEQQVRLYDLGMSFGYKSRWSDEVKELFGLLIIKNT
jgi:hypothetical protein